MMNKHSDGEMKRQFKLLLASKSPRRRELLAMLDYPYEIVEGREVDEAYPDTLTAPEVPVFLSGLKAMPYLDDIRKGEILVTADTVVILDDVILGKPVDETDARAMLLQLSGREHTVVTGVTLTSCDKQMSFSVKTLVKFANLSMQEIDRYLAEYKPMDKAGAYGIQEWIGAVAVERIDGSFYNVMGLPVHQLYCALKDF